ncbi:MAG: HPF/RaiA family ribosome-associated protein [Deltaproteobacteria bacterium]|nr:HPF/RaiA family ribosome-associated protein [Deltaproteobacteria bacterium]
MLPVEIQIEGRNVEILPEWREKIEAELAKMQKHTYERILHARVTIQGTGHHRLGNFEMTIVTTVPDRTITVTRQGEFVLPMIVDAFKALDRQLKEYSAVRQQKVKVHEEASQVGAVTKVFPEEDYGFIETPDGLEVYFHANAVQEGNFEKLAPGTRVEFAQEMGLKGPQATWVRVTE